MLARVLSRLALSIAIVGLTSACRIDGPPPGVTDLRIESPGQHHEAEGFVQLYPPTHLPSTSPDRDQVEVWVKLPLDATIDVELDALERPTLRFPPGTWAERVEFFGHGDERRIADIRGTRIEDDGSQTFYVYRPTAPNPSAPLFGVEWARDDETAHAAATERVIAKLAQLPPAQSMPEARRKKFLDGVRVRNNCAGCHPVSRPDNETPREHGVVDRGTDLSGFFTPQTVLWDEVVLEAYSAHDRSWGDPSIEIRCGGVPLDARNPGARRCLDGSIARGRLLSGVTEPVGRSHLADVCESRKFLLAHIAPNDHAKMALITGTCANN